MTDTDTASPVPLLVVDDEVDLRTLTARRLRRAGFDVSEARDGEDAWEQLQQSVPAALVLDVRMPRLDGIELTRRIRGDARTRDVGVVLLTASVEEHKQAAGADAGADAYLRKPCTTAQLLETVQDVLTRRGTDA